MLGERLLRRPQAGRLSAAVITRAQHRLNIGGAVLLILMAGIGSVHGQAAGRGMRDPLSPLPLSHTPRVVFKGKTVEARAAEVAAVMHDLYTDVPTNSPIYQKFVRHIAATAVPDTFGDLVIHPRVWGDGLRLYNDCARLAEPLSKTRVPDAFRAYLVEYVADTMLTDNSEADGGRLLDIMSRLPADCKVLTDVTPGELIHRIEDVFPSFKTISPLHRRIVMDGIVTINPNLRQAGWRVASAPPGEGEIDQIVVPNGLGLYYVFRFEMVDPGSPILLPHEPLFNAWSQSRRFDLSAFERFDLGLLVDASPTSLDLSCTDITDLAPVAKFPELKRLNLRGTRVSDLSPLSGLPLESLDISCSDVTDLSPVSGLPLRDLQLHHTGVSTLSCLAGMPLRRLDFRQTYVRDLTALAGLPLEELHIDRRVWDGIEVLRKMPELKTVGDYTLENWIQASAEEKWLQPIPLRFDKLRSGGRLQLRFEGEYDPPPEGKELRKEICDYTTVFFEFDTDGRLQCAYAAEDGEGNIIYPFDPLKLTLDGDELTCRAIFSLSFGLKNRNIYSGKVPVYEYSMRGRLGDKGFEGTFHLHYEKEIFSPGAGYLIKVIDVDGRVHGTREALGLYRRPTAPLAAASAWPSWRGPTGSATVNEDPQAPIPDIQAMRLAWVSEQRLPASKAYDSRSVMSRRDTRISGGYGSPIVSGGRLYLSYYEPSGDIYDDRVLAQHLPQNGYGRDKWLIEADDVLLCVDARTGSTAWKRVFPRCGLNFNGFNEGEPQPLLTPCTDGKTVFAIGTGARVYAVDAVSGAPRWESVLGERFDVMERTRSAALRDKRLPRFRRDMGVAPMVAGGVLVCSDQAEFMGGQRKRVSALVGFDLNTGCPLWRVPQICGMTASPVPWTHEGREYVLVSSDTDLRCVDPADGRIAWTAEGIHWPMAPGLSGDLLLANIATPGLVAAFQLGTDGAHRTWVSGPEIPDNASPPVVLGPAAWIATSTNFTCLASANGKLIASVMTEKPKGGLIGVGRSVLLDGFQLGVVADGELLEPVSWLSAHAEGTTPVYVDGRLFVRGRERLYAYEWGE